MDQPTLIDYAPLIMTLFDELDQTNPVVLKYQNLCTYKYLEMIIFFILMQFRRIYEIKAQNRRLQAHPEIRAWLNFAMVPDRTMFLWQYKKLGEVILAFSPFVSDRVTDAVADSQVLDQKAQLILHQLRPASLTADDRYTKALRIRCWIR
ncbi:MAG: hypothetical protein QNJ45_23645 [Ardenticatenaceae bacterium]|nr:hypothetical protein [Ardenticatenaceae bacterium]